MNDEIKSAYEIAMEKLAAMDEPTEAERLSWKYLPAGRTLAAAFLGEKADLEKELAGLDGDARVYTARGVEEVLLGNLALPKTDADAERVAQVMTGMMVLKKDGKAAMTVVSRIKQLCDHYREQGASQMEQAYQQLKTEMAASLQQALSQQAGRAVAAENINVEAQPEFQAEWRRVRDQLEGQYTKLLDECREDYRQLV
jgi:uncharacterized protein DUF6657